MKKICILYITFIFIAAGCTLFKDITQSKKMQIVNAGYRNWSESPVRGDVPEKGTDLAVIIKNWPQGATPAYIVYNNWKSLTPSFSDTSDIGVIINARIVKASSVMQKESQQVDESDRLVYKAADGQTRSITIIDWERVSD